MGLCRHFSDYKPRVPIYEDDDNIPIPVWIHNRFKNPNPDPIKFKIIKETIVNKKSILLVKYKGCTTFGGLKLLLLKKKWNNLKKLDPHLLGENHLVAARFEPNKKGLTLAKICAKNM